MSIAMSLRTWLSLIVVTALVALSGWLYVGREHVREEFATYKAQSAQARLQAEQRARDTEHKLRTEVERIARNEESKRKVLSDRVARLDAVNGRLRDEIARLNGRPVPADPAAAAYAREASVARELLGTCSAEYRDVAAQADGLRDQVSGLLDYVKSVLKLL